MPAKPWFVTLAATLATAAGAADRPVTVSPGSAASTLIESRCPTFSWTAVAGAEEHELVVYEVASGDRKTEPVLSAKIPGSSSSWTPSLDLCLERGGRYAWSVGVVEKTGASVWSAPALFEVVPGPSASELEQALAVVRHYLETRSERPGEARRAATLGDFPLAAEGDPGGAPGLVSRGLHPQGIRIEGDPVLSGYERRASVPFDCLPHAVCQTHITCSTGKKALGGGFFSPSTGVHMMYSFPDTETSWAVRALNDTSVSTPYQAWVLCADTH